MKSPTRLVLVVAMVGALLSSFVAASGAQEAPSGYLVAVNGVSTDPVTVSAGAEEIATGLAYADASQGTLVPAGAYDVTFQGGTFDSTATIVADSGTAQTVVSGFGDDPDTAKAYPIDVSPIDSGMAKVTVWNATGAPVDVVFNGVTTTLQPGEGVPAATVAPGTVTVEIDGLSSDIDVQADSYTDVFAVNDTQTPAIASATVASMTDLIALLAPPVAGDVEVPDVLGQTQADATTLIESAGLGVASTEAPDDAVPAGSVISQDPVAGTIVTPPTTVNIVVSTGPDAPATVPVPDVTGQPAADAQSTLESAGLVVTVTEQPSADVEVGLVISTNPAAGTEVAPGTSVEIAVSTGAEDVVVPDFTGMTKDEATAAAEAAGLTISFVEDPENPDPDGVVVSQDPAAGATAPGGSDVTAQLSPDLGAPWAIVTLDPNRLMTVTGVGLLPDSTVKLSVVDTDLTESVAVQDDGSWSVTFDLSDVDNDTEFLLVEGTAADTSEYEATFKIPAAGQSTDEPTSEIVETDSGFPVWGWVLIGLSLIAIVLLVIRMVTGGTDDSAKTPDTQTTDDA